MAALRIGASLLLKPSSAIGYAHSYGFKFIKIGKRIKQWPASGEGLQNSMQL
jgi:hypothetical protein